MTERALQKKCMDYLKGRDIYALNIHGSSFNTRGISDIIACINGKFVAFELKVGGNDLTPAQRMHKKQIEESWGRHFVCYGYDEFIECIKEVCSD